MDEKNRMQSVDLERAQEISRVTWVGFWANALLSVFKIVAGFSGNSRSVLADGVHSMSDLITDIAVLVGVRFWVAPPDETHPYGHKRLESLVALAIGILLAAAGLGIAMEAFSRMDNHDSGQQVGSIFALTISLISVVTKEWLYRWTIKKGLEIKSDAVVANAWNHRSDALSSLPIALAVAISLWLPAWSVVDLIGAVIMGGFILHASWQICRPAINVLLDQGANATIRDKIVAYALRTEGVQSVHELRTRYMGQGLQVDLHVAVDGSMTVQAANIIAHHLEDAFYSTEAAEQIGVEICDALIHIDPWMPDNDVR